MTLAQLTQNDAVKLLDAANRNDWQQVYDIAKAIMDNSLELLTEEMYKGSNND